MKMQNRISCRSGRFFTYARPSRMAPRPRRTGAGRSSPGFIRNSPSSTATKLNVFTANTGQMPTQAIISPAMAGPISRAPLNDALFSPTALLSRSSGTTSDTNACRAGASKPQSTPARVAVR